MVYQSHIQQQGYTTPCYQQPGSSANLVTPACYPLGIPNQAGTLAPGNLFNISAGFIPQSMASISDAIQAQQFISQATQPLVMCTQSLAQIQQTRVHHAQVSVPQPKVFQPQYQANYQPQVSVPQPIAYQQPCSAVQQLQPMTHQQQR
jgi:hypothetical protein